MTTMKEQFAEFHDANPIVMGIFLKFADELRAAGIIKIRADEVLHRVRWELLTNGNYYDLQIGPIMVLVRGLKTLYGNRYAIELMTRDKTYRSFFDLKVAHDN